MALSLTRRRTLALVEAEAVEGASAVRAGIAGASGDTALALWSALLGLVMWERGAGESPGS